MEFVRRKTPNHLKPPSPATKLSPETGATPPPLEASDALPLPIRRTNKLFSFLFMLSLYHLMSRWRLTIRSPLHSLSLSDISALAAFLASLIYLISFSGIAYVQSSLPSPDDDPPQFPVPAKSHLSAAALPADDEEIVLDVISGKIPSYSLELRLGDCRRAAGIRREAVGRMAGRGMEGLPIDGFDYEAILGQCCEMPVGYVQLPVGVVGPLVLDGREYWVPMATTEGCLVASTNRGCKAIAACGGAASVVLRDGMTRAPVVRFGRAKRAAELKFFLEDGGNYERIANVFNRYAIYIF